MTGCFKPGYKVISPISEKLVLNLLRIKDKSFLIMWMRVLYPRCPTAAPVSKQLILAAVNWTHSYVGHSIDSTEVWICSTG